MLPKPCQNINYYLVLHWNEKKENVSMGKHPDVFENRSKKLWRQTHLGEELPVTVERKVDWHPLPTPQLEWHVCCFCFRSKTPQICTSEYEAPRGWTAGNWFFMRLSKNTNTLHRVICQSSKRLWGCPPYLSFHSFWGVQCPMALM